MMDIAKPASPSGGTPAQDRAGSVLIRAKIVQTIRELTALHGEAPTYAELAAHMNLAASTIHRHVRNAIADGTLASTGVPRGLVVTARLVVTPQGPPVAADMLAGIYIQISAVIVRYAEENHGAAAPLAVLLEAIFPARIAKSGADVTLLQLLGQMEVLNHVVWTGIGWAEVRDR